MSFLFPEPDIVLEAGVEGAEEQVPSYAILRLNTDEDGRTWLAWEAASAVPSKRLALKNKAGMPVPPPPVFDPLILINGSFEMLAINSSDGTRWSYSNSVISTDGGPTFKVSGKCKLIELTESDA